MEPFIKPRPNIHDLIPYVPGKPIEELERELGIRNAVKIASNENPVGPSPLALKAIKEKLNTINYYPDGDCYFLKRKLSEELGVGIENIIFGNGSNEVIEIVAKTFLGSRDEAIYGEHAFIVYPLVTQSIGAKHIVSPMPELVHNLEDMYKRISSKTKLIFIANPNNPTGTIVKKKEIEWFLRNVPKEIIIIVDEAYFEYVDFNEYPNTLDYHNIRESLVTVRTFSKIYGLAGLRIGYGIASKSIISLLNRVREPFNVNFLAQVAALAALDDDEHLERSRTVNNEGMKYLEGELKRLGISFIKSYANFILIDMKYDPIQVYEDLLKEGVIVRPVGAYGLKNHLRVSIGNESDNIKFIESLAKVIGK